MAKKDNPYFNDFISMIELSCKAAEFLQRSIKNYDPETLSEQRITMHKIENEEDQLKHAMTERLMKEFVPPIDREDIATLSHELDNITDKIENVLLRMYMYDIRHIREEAFMFSDIILRCCNTLREAMIEFPNFRKSKILPQKIVEVNAMEEEGDELYIEAMHKLYKECDEPITLAIWSKLFDLFEQSCDACEHVANMIERVIMKNC